jgi:hypothetical protein
MSTGESTPSDTSGASSEPSGYRPPVEQGQQSTGGYSPDGSAPQWQQPPGGQSYPPPGQPYQAPGQPYPPPGAYQRQGYQAPGQGYQAEGQQYPGGGYGAPGPAAQAPLTPQEERTWAMAAHLSSILGVWVFFLGAVGPLVVMLTQGPRSPYVRAQSVEALNFNISVLIYSVIAWILVIVLIGFVALAALFVFQVVFTIIAAVKTSNGESYRYPLTIRLVS